jgi:hypothetical protein
MLVGWFCLSCTVRLPTWAPAGCKWVRVGTRKGEAEESSRFSGHGNKGAARSLPEGRNNFAPSPPPCPPSIVVARKYIYLACVVFCSRRIRLLWDPIFLPMLSSHILMLSVGLHLQIKIFAVRRLCLVLRSHITPWARNSIVYLMILITPSACNCFLSIVMLLVALWLWKTIPW